MRRVVALVFAMSLVLTAIARGAELQPPLQNVALQDAGQSASRFYAAGIMGSSFATLTSSQAPSATGPLFTSGGAIGLAVALPDGAWRMEIEGRARDPLVGTTVLDDAVSTSTLAASGGWSTTTNLWRDYDLTERLTGYIGGGIGGGGYNFGVNQQYPVQDVTVTGSGNVGGFAWQVGGGLAFAVTDRITLDLGYRFFELASGSATAQVAQSGLLIDSASFDSGFSASELFFAIRIYEPFRGWR